MSIDQLKTINFSFRIHTFPFLLCIIPCQFTKRDSVPKFVSTGHIWILHFLINNYTPNNDLFICRDVKQRMLNVNVKEKSERDNDVQQRRLKERSVNLLLRYIMLLHSTLKYTHMEAAFALWYHLQSARVCDFVFRKPFFGNVFRKPVPSVSPSPWLPDTLD